MNIKHFIIIRFYCYDMTSRDVIFNYDFLKRQLEVFCEFTLKSLQNQTNKNFEILLLIHNELPLENKIYENLNELKYQNVNFIYLKDLNQYIYDNSKLFDYVITTRLDNDDLIYNNAVNDIQNIVLTGNYDLIYCGLKCGLTMINKDIENIYEFIPNYNSLGTISIFQTLAYNRKCIEHINNIYQLGQHTNNINTFINLAQKYNYLYYINIIEEKNTWIYVKHDFNHSSIKKNNYRWHRSFNKINFSKDYFANRFGNI